MPRRLYPKEFKINAVLLVQVEGRRANNVADELGIGTKLSTLGFMMPAPAFRLESPKKPAKLLLMKPKLLD